MLAPGNGRVAVAARGIKAAPTRQSCVAATPPHIKSPPQKKGAERRFCPTSSPTQKKRRRAPGSRVAASPNVSPGQWPRSGRSPGYKSCTHKTELRSCDSTTHQIPPAKERRRAPSSRGAASLNLSPGQRPRSGHSPGYKSCTHKTELRSCESITHQIHTQKKGA